MRFLLLLWCSLLPMSAQDAGTRIVAAARKQVGVTFSYDPSYVSPRPFFLACMPKPELVFATAPRPRHSHAMQTTLVLDASNRIVLSRELRRAAGIPRLQKLKVSATPGRIILEMEQNSTGRVVKRGRLKVWTGSVPPMPIDAAVERARHYAQ